VAMQRTNCHQTGASMISPHSVAWPHNPTNLALTFHDNNRLCGIVFVVHNAAARLVLNLGRRAHISPALQRLHWLPVKHRVTFKIPTLMRQILQKRRPSYLADMVTFNTTYSQRRHLRSSTTRSAAVRRTRTHFGKRAFSVCGLDVWNSLPIALRNIDSYPAFRRALKSHLFICAFSHNCYPTYSLTL